MCTKALNKNLKYMEKKNEKSYLVSHAGFSLIDFSVWFGFCSW
jgi:hypothetical protein